MTGNIASSTLPSIYKGPAFDTIAEEYDRMFTHSILGKAQRSLVHEALRDSFREGQHVLDLNCGTGEDAILMAARGISVLACDVSKRMINVAWQKLATLPQRLTAPRFPLKAVDFINRGVPKGPSLGAALRVAEQAWIDADFTSDAAAIDVIADRAARDVKTSV